MGKKTVEQKVEVQAENGKTVSIDVAKLRAMVEQLLAETPAMKELSTSKADITKLVEGLVTQAQLQELVSGLAGKKELVGLATRADVTASAEALQKYIEETQGAMLEGIALAAQGMAKDTEVRLEGLVEGLQRDLGGARSSITQAIEGNAGLPVRGYRWYKAQVHRLAPESEFWRGMIYTATAVVVIGILGEAIGYFAGVPWCRPSTYWAKLSA